MKRLLNILYILFFPLWVFCQFETVLLKAELWCGDKPCNTYISGKIANASFAGKSSSIRVQVKPASEVPIQVDGKWKILYPLHNRIPLPRDTNLVVRIILAEDNDQDNYQAILNEIKDIQQEFEHINSNQKNALDFSEQEFQYLNRNLAKVLKEQMINYERIKVENDRIMAMEKAKEEKALAIRQLETYKDLSVILDHFVVAIQDVRDSWEREKRVIFSSYKAVDRININLEKYNLAFQELEKNRNQLISQIGLGWSEESNVYNRAQVTLEYALDDLHRGIILPSNTLLTDVDNLNNRVPRKYRRRKADIVRDIEEFIYKLTKSINILVDRKREVYDQMRP